MARLSDGDHQRWWANGRKGSCILNGLKFARMLMRKTDVSSHAVSARVTAPPSGSVSFLIPAPSQFVPDTRIRWKNHICDHLWGKRIEVPKRIIFSGVILVELGQGFVFSDFNKKISLRCSN